MPLSMDRTAPALAALFMLLLSAVALPAPEAERVCVLGAGPSGVVAAYRLENRGYDVAVLDKNDYVGGRTYTYSYKDRPVEMVSAWSAYSILRTSVRGP